MADVYKEVASSQDYENKWTYFGAADGSYSIYPGVCVCVYMHARAHIHIHTWNK